MTSKGTPKKFLLLFHPRSGSSWLISMLQRIAGWHVRYELLSPRELSIISSTSQIEFLRSYYLDRKPTDEVRGFKAAPFQIIDKPAVIDFINDNAISVICLTRDNSVKAAVSAVRAEKLSRELRTTKRGKTNLRASDPAFPPIEIPAENLLYELRRIETEKNNVLLMARSLSRTLHISYESLRQDLNRIQTRIGAFLDVSITGMGPTEIKKMTPERLSKAIVNYHEIESLLAESYYEEQLKEGE